MIHPNCDGAEGCGMAALLRLDRPLSPEVAVACERCWRFRHGKPPLEATTSPDLAQYVDDIDARPAFLEILHIQRRRLMGEAA